MDAKGFFLTRFDAWQSSNVCVVISKTGSWKKLTVYQIRFLYLKAPRVNCIKRNFIWNKRELVANFEIVFNSNLGCKKKIVEFKIKEHRQEIQGDISL